MKFRSRSAINEFVFHDSSIVDIELNGRNVRVNLAFAHILKGHPSNPMETAQCIKPCVIEFIDVSSQSARLWDETARAFKEHPAPHSPLSCEISKFYAGELNDRVRARVTGFHREGWSEWTLECAAIEVAWDEFAGSAWFVNWPDAPTVP